MVTHSSGQRPILGHFLRAPLWSELGFVIGLVLLVTTFPAPLWAQKEVTSDIYRYGGREVSARFYEKYERKHRAHLPFVGGHISRRELIFLAPTAERVRRRSYMADSHWGGGSSFTNGEPASSATPARHGAFTR
jgi:hypothetical protein